ncbi:UTP--glucose-1-phosphate uridylyltransferase [Pontibacter ummariensis]|uniref:UTP--glucose-1-phosphate uridylyltransferase n=1 Tax=Pontibacter ummariensis TaxID=1610492 RepID=A0A239D6T5_9BACT|nr:UTP--glucose-1-phosphate uridylyltransferase [Pontibacter ummariensis]PRY14265.1 UTP--glucose-1-phosphate uridylyltransferase [Pontibacter ummariensis]SNS27728.1 UTP--glucose-1-phosphate uridylyltransferase [Pontibacter ummariensis]
MNVFIETITSTDTSKRNRSFYEISRKLSPKELLQALRELDTFRKTTSNLYDKVRAILFLYAGFRFFLMEAKEVPATGKINYEGFEDLLARRFEHALTLFWAELDKHGPNATLCSAFADSYHHLSFQILGDQVRKSVRSSKGNQWMFRVGHQEEHPVRIHPKLLQRPDNSLFYPVLHESTSVRMDLTHSGWSDIFFLGMDYPEGARVINVSIDLGVFGRDKDIRPPLHSYVRVIPEPVLRLTSIDLNTTKDVQDLADLFNFGNDYLSLVKAGVIASGLVPPSFEGTNQSLADILSRVVAPGMGIELVTKVNDIPKGSRFAVSTNLLGSIISLLMRATCQTQSLEGGLQESERRLVASRAILGEWIGGSGGGWQDSGGVWPGIKAIQGTFAEEGDPEFGVSRGTLLPRHRVLQGEEVHPELEHKLMNSLVLMHGGMASNVGPILEMVTEKYLLRGEKEWEARQQTNQIFDNILAAIKEGDIQKLGANTARNWEEPIKTIIPWASTYFTEQIIAKAKKAFGEDYYGFLMLGGMSGGGMGMFVSPDRHEEYKLQVLEILRQTKQELSSSLPFAMEPVVYNWSINHKGTWASLHEGEEALMPEQYYAIHVSELVRKEPHTISYVRRAEIDHFTTYCEQNNLAYPLLRTIVSNLFKVSDPSTQNNRGAENEKADQIKKDNGFDYIQHEEIREQLQKGRIGLSRNRLPAETSIEDVRPEDLVQLDALGSAVQTGEVAIAAGKVAVMSLAAGVGSRWTKGAGVIKALNPFVEIAGEHRSFLEIHLAKTRKVAEKYSASIPHLIATSYLTHEPIRRELEQTQNFGYEGGSTYLSPGRSIGQRFVPMERDLRFMWEEMPQETLDENKQKVRDAVRSSMINWARSKGEGTDYVDNIAAQRFSPLGHWYEVSNLLRNGTLAKLLQEHPQLETIMLHNIDTLGADVHPAALGYHLASGNVLTFEVVPRRIEDRGGGLARVNGKVRLLEGLAQPREEDELNLSYYNSMTTWIQVDLLLELFGLTREDLQQGDEALLARAVRSVAHRIPTYVTIKDVKYRWGHGQEDIYPVAQIEKLWSDMSALPDVKCGYIAVPRYRGQQLKDPAQLDAWVTDGSKDYVASLGTFASAEAVLEQEL